jgi:hypothetical protein
MSVFYVDSASGALSYSNRAWTLGDRMVPALTDGSSNALVAKAWVWEVTTAGTTTATPTWPAPGTVTQDTTTVTQNGVVFKARKPGFSSGSTVDWTFATIFIQHGLLAAAAGDTVYVINTHSVTSATSLTWASNGTPGNLCNIICLNNKTTSTPTASDIGTGAKETTQTNQTHAMTGSFYCYGGNLDNGTASNTSTLGFCNATTMAVQVFEQCTFRSMSTSSTAIIGCGSNSQATGTSRLVWRNCYLTINSAAGIRLNDCIFEWRGGSYVAGATSPTVLVSQMGLQAGRGATCRIIGVDLTGLGSSASIFPQGAQGAGRGLIRDCVMPSGWSGGLVSGTPLSFPFGPFEAFNLSVDGTPITGWSESFYGTLKDSTTATQGSHAYSWQIQTSANAGFPDSAFESVEIFEQVAAADVGVSKTYTIPFIRDSVTALNDDDIYGDVWYPGSSTSSQYSKASDAKSSVLATAAAQTSSSATWTNSMTNPNAQEVAVTFTPQQPGQIIIGVRVCRPSTTVYVSPFGTLS